MQGHIWDVLTVINGVPYLSLRGSPGSITQLYLAFPYVKRLPGKLVKALTLRFYYTWIKVRRIGCQVHGIKNRETS